jgi:arginine repressor
VIKIVEQEHQLKLAIRNELARNPIISVVQLQNALKERGFKTTQGNPLDWRYVSKILRKLNREKAMAVDQQKVNERLAVTKERYRVITDRLWKIIDYKMEYLDDHIRPPDNADIWAGGAGP